jgi:dUTP pyrophosphatase
MDENLEKYVDELKHLRDLGILPKEDLESIDNALDEVRKLEEMTEPNNSYKLQINFVNKSDLPNPEYAKEGDSGFDLRATEGGELGSLERTLVPTGLYFELPQGYELQVRPRSGLAAKYGVTVLNTPGTVDTGYRGEIKVILVNLSKEPYKWERGERIAQAVISHRVGSEFGQLNEVVELSETSRGTGGFGSTGTE